MMSNRKRIGALVIRVQNHFLAHPQSALTPEEAQRLFRANAAMCDAVLGLLTESGVAVKTADGAYTPARPHADARTVHAA